LAELVNRLSYGFCVGFAEFFDDSVAPVPVLLSWGAVFLVAFILKQERQDVIHFRLREFAPNKPPARTGLGAFSFRALIMVAWW
jgi:hypothetical protein